MKGTQMKFTGQEKHSACRKMEAGNFYDVVVPVANL
jgi:hypothetical protein